jgi:predicted Zn-dependent protease
MKLTRMTPPTASAASILCIALLSGCASTGEGTAAARPAQKTVAAAMAEADAAVMAGQNDKAYSILKHAGAAFPAEKTPWVRMAQMRFDSANYGEAIVNALAALERDPEDTLANSIVAVSGLRVTSRSLADLSEKNNLTGNVRTEAQELAKLLRANLNENELVPGANRGGAVRAAAGQAKKVIAAPSAARAAAADPFGTLK